MWNKRKVIKPRYPRKKIAEIKVAKKIKFNGKSINSTTYFKTKVITDLCEHN